MNRKPRIRGTTPEIEQAAKKLRKNLTSAEAILWQALRNKQLEGLRFRRQHPVGNFILDFYCPSRKLVIEVDGKIHDRRINYDRARTSKLYHLSLVTRDLDGDEERRSGGAGGIKLFVFLQLLLRNGIS